MEWGETKGKFVQSGMMRVLLDDREWFKKGREKKKEHSWEQDASVLATAAAHSCCRAELTFSRPNSLSGCGAARILRLQLLGEVALYRTQVKAGYYGKKRFGLCVLERLCAFTHAFTHKLKSCKHTCNRPLSPPTNRSPPYTQTCHMASMLITAVVILFKG